jgi:hypothetical protein
MLFFCKYILSCIEKAIPLLDCLSIFNKIFGHCRFWRKLRRLRQIPLRRYSTRVQRTLPDTLEPEVRPPRRPTDTGTGTAAAATAAAAAIAAAADYGHTDRGGPRALWPAAASPRPLRSQKHSRSRSKESSGSQFG